MLTKTAATLAAVIFAGIVATAQQAPPPQGVKPGEAPVGPAPSRTPAQLVNIRIDLTITEQREGSKLPPRTVTMLIGDRENGRVRTGHTAASALLNVDARPEIVRDGRIRVFLTLEYRPQAAEGDKMQPSMLTESLTSILEDGKPLIVSQSADPTSTRAGVMVELKATIAR
jgi:hypothetical protein